MSRMLGAITVLVPSYEAGLAFFVEVLGFELVEDTRISDDKRWVLVSPSQSAQTRILLAKAASDPQNRALGQQAGGRVFLFLNTDDFDRDHKLLISRGVTFLEPAREEPYGKVAVFQDPFGNKWDLIQPVGA